MNYFLRILGIDYEDTLLGDYDEEEEATDITSKFSNEITYIQLEKKDAGLGFSILDCQVSRGALFKLLQFCNLIIYSRMLM